jgi:hypothetical protein
MRSGLKAALYRNKKGKNILAFSGSDGLDPKDWKTNIYQAIGFQDTQYKEVEKVVIAAQSKGPINIITGHSLGGGLATLATIIDAKINKANGVNNVGGNKLIIFNPAYLSINTIENLVGEAPPPETFFKDAHVWHVTGDPLTIIQAPAALIGLYSFPKNYFINTETRLFFDRVERHALNIFEAYFKSLDSP